MDHHPRAALVQLRQERLERRVARVAAGVAREQPDTVHVQVIQSPHGLGARLLYVAHRKDRERPEPAGVFVHHRCCVGVALACERRRALRGHKLDAGIGDREHLHRDAV